MVALGTLAVAAVFQPARRRVQTAVDLRFNRRRYDAATAVEAFSVQLRDELDADVVSDRLLSVAEQTMQPTRISVWLRPPEHEVASARREVMATSDAAPRPAAPKADIGMTT